MDKKRSFYTVAQLREQIKDLDDSVPIIASPIDANVKVVVDFDIRENVELNFGNSVYKGSVFVIQTGLRDIKTDRDIILNT